MVFWRKDSNWANGIIFWEGSSLDSKTSPQFGSGLLPSAVYLPAGPWELARWDMRLTPARPAPTPALEQLTSQLHHPVRRWISSSTVASHIKSKPKIALLNQTLRLDCSCAASSLPELLCKARTLGHLSMRNLVMKWLLGDPSSSAQSEPPMPSSSVCLRYVRRVGVSKRRLETFKSTSLSSSLQTELPAINAQTTEQASKQCSYPELVLGLGYLPSVDHLLFYTLHLYTLTFYGLLSA